MAYFKFLYGAISVALLLFALVEISLRLESIIYGDKEFSIGFLGTNVRSVE